MNEIEKTRQFRIEANARELARRGHSLNAEEQAILLDIVRQYYNGTATPQNAMAWVYGLVANSALWHEPRRQEPYSSLSHPAGPCLMGCGLCAAY